MMMKRVLLLLLPLFFLACEEKNSDTETGSVILTVSENEVYHKKQIVLTAEIDNVSSYDVKVYLKLAGNAIKDKNYFVEEDLITISANTKSASLAINVLEFSNTDLSIDIEISSVDGAEIGDLSQLSIILKSLDSRINIGNIKVNANSEKQTVRGFGATYLSSNNRMIPTITTEELATVFDVKDKSLGLSILRLKIPHKKNELNKDIYVAEEAAARGVTIIASAWTPPIEMKTNENVFSGYLKKESYADYAAHLKNYVDSYKNYDITIDAISIQNEPDRIVESESCLWESQMMIDFLTNYAKDIGDVKIIAPESFMFRKAIMDSILNDVEAVANVDIVGGHIYGGGIKRHTLALEKGKEVWMTEHTFNHGNGNYIELASTISDCMEVDMSTYIWKYLYLDSPLIIKNKITKLGHSMSQFSRFVRPEFTRVEVENNSEIPFKITAYKKDNQIVIVVVNDNERAMEFDLEIEDIDVKGFDLFATTRLYDCENIAVFKKENKNMTVYVPEKSVSTFVSK